VFHTASSSIPTKDNAAGFVAYPKWVMNFIRPQADLFQILRHTGLREASSAMNNKSDGSSKAGNGPHFRPERKIAPPGLSRSVFDLKILQRGRRWKWQVCDQNDMIVLYGWEKSRPIARYQGYRAMFLLLRASCLAWRE
jgi:hypothetical protein